MKMITSSCISCGAPLGITDLTEKIKCNYCGVAMTAGLDNGILSFKVVEKVTREIAGSVIEAKSAVIEASNATQSSIRESASSTQEEIKRLQIQQEISATKMQLSDIQTEIRSIERENQTRQTRKQLVDLRQQEMGLRSQVASLQDRLSPKVEVPWTPHSKQGDYSHLSSKSQMIAFFLCLFLGFFGAHRFYVGRKRSAFLQLFTAGGYMIWWFIDIYSITAGIFTDSADKPLRGANTKKMKITLAIWFIFIFLPALLNGFTSAEKDQKADLSNSVEQNAKAGTDSSPTEVDPIKVNIVLQGSNLEKHESYVSYTDENGEQLTTQVKTTDWETGFLVKQNSPIKLVIWGGNLDNQPTCSILIDNKIVNSKKRLKNDHQVTCAYPAP